MKLLIYLISFKDDRLYILLGTGMAASCSFPALGSAPVTREVTSPVQDFPSRIFQERDRTDRGKQKHLTQLWHLPETIWQSPPCASQGSLYRELLTVDALDS